MPLFEVPGWSVPATAPSQSAQKRKRPANGSTDKVQAAERNLDKLMNKLKGDNKSQDEIPRAAKKRKRFEGDSGEVFKASNATDNSIPGGRKSTSARGSRNGKNNRGDTKLVISSPRRLMPKQDDSKTLRESSEALANASMASLARHRSRSPGASVGLGGGIKSPPAKPLTTTIKPAKATVAQSSKSNGLTAMQDKMKHSLEGARFRWINESLYKAESSKSHQLMREDPKVYEEYHIGFRHQVQSWPTNPVLHYITTLSTYPTTTIIADLGCGDAAIARKLVPSGYAVLSFDLVSDDAFVVEADTCQHIPLPGSEGTQGEGAKSEGEGHVVDVAVCALSLMGTNWMKCIREAWRILKPGGELKIAEVTSRFTDVEEFTSLISSVGFKLKSKDDSNSHFTLFEFKKVARKARNEKEWSILISQGAVLKPCKYKRR